MGAQIQVNANEGWAFYRMGQKHFQLSKTGSMNPCKLSFE